jgi:3-isopropylmalate/(R)-2-methylmalate dehydratase large subunit
MNAPRTLFDKIWQRHVVVDRGDGHQLIYVDRHLLHDGSSTAFETLRQRGLPVRRPELALATPADFTSTARSRPASPRRTWCSRSSRASARRAASAT